jgi:oligoendopeptidase F
MRTSPWLVPLPASSHELADASWDEVRALYEAVAAQPLDATTVDRWLPTWSRLEELLSEAAVRAMIAYTCDTSDPAKERAHLRFSAEIMPRAEEKSIELARRLVASGLSPVGLEIPLRRFRTAIAIFREANVPLMAGLEQLGAAYQRLTGAMTAEWEGRRLPLPMLAPFLQHPTRAVREQAWRASVLPYVDARPTLVELFDQMFRRRVEVARNAGFPSFREYIFAARFRFDYTPADCQRFHDAVEEVVVPALERTLAVRRARLGIESLRPWDLDVNPYRSTPIRPYDEPAELPRIAHRIFGRVDPVLGQWFQVMMDEGLLDLESRPGKAPGGYCDMLHASGRPFIFMNGSGVMEDVVTLFHEAGHAFHAFASHRQPFIWQRHPQAESAELASMSMELLALTHLARPVGYLDEVEARCARLDHLEGILSSLTHIASVDAFQHWLYVSGEGEDAEARDAAWLRIRQRFDPGVDWSGLTQERTARWYRQLHIFLHPLYYIEYGLAQLGALQVWRNTRRDPVAAVAAYRQFLDLGATRPLPELYATAGARLVFDGAGMRELVDLVEQEIEAVRSGLPPMEVARG